MSKIKVLLTGGPSYLPSRDRVQFTDSLKAPIKHQFGAGYEHFTHQGGYRAHNGEELPVFEWVARTVIAE